MGAVIVVSLVGVVCPDIPFWKVGKYVCSSLNSIKVASLSQFYLTFDCVRICIPSAGAMRLPCRPEDPNKTHYLSDFYVQKFELEVVDFVNENTNGFLKFYNMPKIRMEGRPLKVWEIVWLGVQNVIWTERILVWYFFTIYQSQTRYGADTPISL